MLVTLFVMMLVKTEPLLAIVALSNLKKFIKILNLKISKLNKNYNRIFVSKEEIQQTRNIDIINENNHDRPIKTKHEQKESFPGANDLNERSAAINSPQPLCDC